MILPKWPALRAVLPSRLKRGGRSYLGLPSSTLDDRFCRAWSHDGPGNTHAWIVEVFNPSVAPKACVLPVAMKITR